MNLEVTLYSPHSTAASQPQRPQHGSTNLAVTLFADRLPSDCYLSFLQRPHVIAGGPKTVMKDDPAQY